MKLGIFAKTFPRDSLEANLDALVEHGLSCTQYNLQCAGLSTLPDTIDDDLCARIRSAHSARGLSMAAISGTFNIIDHDRDRLEANMARFEVLVHAAPKLGTHVVTLCTGSCDMEEMWRRHPDNDSDQAWQDMLASMRRIVAVAEAAGIDVAIEPEVNNIVSSAKKARLLLDAIPSSRLKVIFDAANLFHGGNIAHMQDVHDEALDLLGRDIVIAHAKDISPDGHSHQPAGTGLLDYRYFLAGLRRCGFDGPLIVHGLDEHQVPGCLQFLRKEMAALAEQPPQSD